MKYFNIQPKNNLSATVSYLLPRTLAIGLFLGAFLLLYLPLSAQPGTIIWENNYGGSDEDFASSVQQTDDGGYIVAGSSESADGDVSGNSGDEDYWVMKLDASGNILWEGNYGGSGIDLAGSVQQTDDGGYIVAGSSESDDGDVSGNNGSFDYWLVKLDSSGTILWEGNYGGGGLDEASSVQQTDDGGYIVAGSSLSAGGDLSGNNGFSDYWLVKLDVSGIIQWENNYGGSNRERARSVQQTDDGGYIVAGLSRSDDGDVSGNNGVTDYWLVKLDTSGNILWEGNYGGSNGDEAKSVQQTDDGGYIVAGTSISDDGDVSGNNGTVDYWLVKLDASGTILWEGNYGGSDFDVASSVQQTDDGGYIVAGMSFSNDGDVSGNNGFSDYWLLKLDSSGIILWEGNYGGGSIDEAPSVQQTDDGGYIVAGNSSSDDGDVSGNNGQFGNDYWLVKLNGSGTTGISGNSLQGSIKLYPNPTREKVTVELPEAIESLNATVLDATGRKISEEKIENTTRFQLKLGEEAGLYFVELEYADGLKTVRKVIKE